MTTSILGALLFAYFLAGIPIGLLVGRLRGIPDIRELGSGNIGATNVLRVLGTKAGVFVWVTDCLKGAVPVLAARYLFGLEGWAVGAAGVAATAGHCFSPYLRLTGGRGVSTGLGVVTGLFWPAGICALTLFAVVVAKTRYVSLGSITAASSTVVWIILWGHFIDPYTFAYAVMAAACAAIIVARHAPNIQRLCTGTERKLGQKVTAEHSQGEGANAGV